MYKSPTATQLGIFGDGWIYKAILSQLKNHPLTKLRPIADKTLTQFDAKLKSYYSLHQGRPSFSPGVILKMLLLGYLYRLSDAVVSKICVHDFLFRWFIGIDPMERVPDATTLAKFRSRLKEEGFHEIFDELVKIAVEQGFTRRKLKTHVFYDIPKPRYITLLKQRIRKAIKKFRM